MRIVDRIVSIIQWDDSDPPAVCTSDWRHPRDREDRRAPPRRLPLMDAPWPPVTDMSRRSAEATCVAPTTPRTRRPSCRATVRRSHPGRKSELLFPFFDPLWKLQVDFSGFRVRAVFCSALVEPNPLAGARVTVDGQSVDLARTVVSAPERRPGCAITPPQDCHGRRTGVIKRPGGRGIPSCGTARPFNPSSPRPTWRPGPGGIAQRLRPHRRA